MNTNDKYTHFSSLRVGVSGQNDKKVNLFTHPFYYLQNDIKDTDTRNCVKALLFLHTLQFYYPTVNKNNEISIKSFFNSTSGNSLSGMENEPYGYLLFLGGLLWRSRLENDPILYEKENVYKFKKPNSKNDPLFAIVKTNGRKCPNFCVSETTDYYGADYARMENICNITNIHDTAQDKLIKLFIKFVDNEWKTICERCELQVYKKSKNKRYFITATSFKYIFNLLSSSEYVNNLDKTMKLLNGEETIKVSNDSERDYEIRQFKNNYVMAFVKDGLLYSFYSENNPIQDIFRSLFYKEVIVTTISNQYNEVNVHKNGLGVESRYMSQYFEGYGEVIENYIKTEETEIKKDDKNGKEVGSIDVVNDKDAYDFVCNLYMTLKNLWDRWLCGYYNMGTTKVNGRNIDGKKIFDVQNFFNNNFVFIDSFYNNIYNTLKLNCTNLLELYEGQGNNENKLGTTAVAHLGSVASKHMCMMFNFPDSVNFAEVDDNGQAKEVDMLQNMKEVFTPINVNQISEPEYSNKFTVIYTHPANKLDTVDRNNFVSDTFDIWSFDDGNNVAPAVFKSNGTDDTGLLTGGSSMGYKVPAFGIAYSRQDNSIWKNINVGMDNFSVTEQSIRTLDQIAQKGNSEPHNITFYGQDVYSLYQSYSYLVTVEMLGDVQIQPLMYFQLMNVPMFRGTYMIIKVEHNITPGYMTTVFTGMKMSKVQMPFAKDWFKTSDDSWFTDQNTDENSESVEKVTASDGNSFKLDNNRLSSVINKYLNQDLYCDDFVIKVYDELGVKINNLL